jgi:hypothetical protein
MKKKKFDLEPKIEKLDDIPEERLESIEDRFALALNVSLPQPTS